MSEEGHPSFVLPVAKVREFLVLLSGSSAIVSFTSGIAPWLRVPISKDTPPPTLRVRFSA